MGASRSAEAAIIRTGTTSTATPRCDYDTSSGRIRIGPINRYGNGGEFTYRALMLQAEFVPMAGQFVRLSYTVAHNESHTRTTLDGAGRENSLRGCHTRR